MKKIVFVFLSIVLTGSVWPGSFHEDGFRLSGSFSPGPAGNGIIDLLSDGDDLYIAADEGVSITSDFGETFLRSTRENGIGKGGVSALDVRDGVIWIATGFDTTTSQGNLPAGGGVGYSLNSGESWQWFRQPRDSKDVESYKPTTTNVQNITYDLALTDDAVWIASFGGGLRKSADMGETWQVVTVDGLPFDALGYLRHRTFAVVYDGEAVWVGSAGGIHKSMDGGDTWTTFDHAVQDQPISGNFVVALGVQKTQTRQLIWAATWPTTTESGDDSEYKAVSFSADGGLTWQTVLEGESAHNFAFRDSIAYVATDNGVFMSPDFGKTWAVYPPVYDSVRNIAIYDGEANSVAAGPDEALWIATSDGLALTRDNGLTWSIFQAYIVPGEAGEPDTYASPNPFSPARDHRLNDEGHCRFVYQVRKPQEVTVSVYDFGMNLVTALTHVAIHAGTQSEPVWNGNNDLGDPVANGVYFYRIRVNGEGEYWGKIMVVN